MQKRYLNMVKRMSENSDPAAARDWSVYMLSCRGGTLYTGVAKDVGTRLKKHRTGKGAAYTRTHLPVRLVYREDGYTRSEALVREAAIKAYPRAKKKSLCARRRVR